MRLLILVTDAFGGRGGIAKFNRDLISAIAAAPTRAQCLVVPRVIVEPNYSVPSGIEIDQQASRGAFSYIRAVITAMLTRRTDAVICGHINLIPLGVLASRLRGVPLLLVVHGKEAWCRPRSAIAARLVHRADIVVAVSAHTRDRFVLWSGYPHDQTRVIGNCVELDRFTVGPASDVLARRYGLAGRIVLLSVARMLASERYKGLDEMLDLLPALAADLPTLSFLIVGEGDDRSRLEQKAERLGIADRVVFAGYIDEREKVEHYRLANAFVMPGRGEGFGIVYLEAMACGVPVVASTADASAEVVAGAATAFVADPSDPKALRDAVLAALRAPRGIVAPAIHRFSRARFVDAWQGMLAEFVSRRRPTSAEQHANDMTQVEGHAP